MWIINKIVKTFIKKVEWGWDVKALALNPYNITHNVEKIGLNKRGLPFHYLRHIARSDSLIRVAISAIKKSVSQSEWQIKEKPHAPEWDYDSQKQQIYELLEYMNDNEENMRIMLDRLIEDLLVLDAGVVEIVKSLDGSTITGLNAVDWATIRPNYDKYGILGDPAYVQVVSGQKQVEFSKDEIIYMMSNPLNDLNSFWYGLSPIEWVLLTVQASLEADLYNIKTFSNDNVPSWLLDLWDRSDSQAQDFITSWNAINLWGNTQWMRFTWWNETPSKYTAFNKGQKDMQFVEYIDWLSRIKLAAFWLSGIDANILQDVNRATWEVQSVISRSRGVQSVKRLIEESFTRKVIWQMWEDFKNLEFKFITTDTLDEKKTQSEIDKTYVETGILTVNEVREQHWLPPLENEEITIESEE